MLKGDVQPKQSGNAKSRKYLEKANDIIFLVLLNICYVDYIITVNTASGLDIF